jgi:hypothetical protein
MSVCVVAVCSKHPATLSCKCRPSTINIPITLLQTCYVFTFMNIALVTKFTPNFILQKKAKYIYVGPEVA